MRLPMIERNLDRNRRGLTRRAVSIGVLILVAGFYVPLFVGLCRGASSVQGIPRESVKTTQKDDIPLKLSSTIGTQSYCDSGSLRLMLRLRFTNVSDRPIILYKYSKIIDGFMITSSLKKALANEYDVSALQSVVLRGERMRATEIPGEAFIILKPGDSHEIDSVLYLALSRVSYEDSLSITPGKHYLRLKLRTWTESQEMAATLSHRWQRFGILWSKPIISEPIEVNVAYNKPKVKCLD